MSAPFCQDATCFGTTILLFVLFTNTTLNCLGCEMLTMGAAVFHWLYFDYINYKLVPVAKKIVQYPVKLKTEDNGRVLWSQEQQCEC